MQSRGRTLHTCSHHNRFFKINFQKTFLVRTRVQSIVFEMQNFDFESAFAVLFESTTKPHREAQKYIFEGILFNINQKFQ